MAGVSLRSVDKWFDRVHAVQQVDLEIDDREFVSFLGPSGCGKSTLLRLIAGLEEVSSGRILIGGSDVTELPPSQRGVAMVFQSYALYPHMTAERNITFGLSTAHMDEATIANKVKEAARMLRLQDLLDRKPAQLSGGQRQRVAIGRAIVRDPSVFLFDEPLSNLDAALRSDMRLEIRSLCDRLGATMIYVTHDQIEAMTMSDRIAVLNNGHLEQVGRPLELYHFPASLFVAAFIGSPRMNLLATQVTAVEQGDVQVALPGGVSLSLPCPPGKVGLGDPVTFGIRPEHLRLGESGDVGLNARIRYVERLGAESILHAETGGGLMLTVRVTGDIDAASDAQIWLGIRAADCHLFGSDGLRLNSDRP